MAVAASKRVSDEVADVLRRSTIAGNALMLPPGQLDRKLYSAVNDVLERLGGQWSRKAKAHVFDGDPAAALAEVLGTGKAPAKNPLAFFPTPPAVSRLMHDFAEMSAAGPAPRVLEPSAGEGDIARAIRAECPSAEIVCVELDEGRAETLGQQGFRVLRRDFVHGLTRDEIGSFDRVLMNPPFAVVGNPTAYIDHVLHAASMLAPGGRLVSVCPTGFTFGRTRKLEAFRAWINGRGGRWHDLPEKSFAGSWTGVFTCLVVLHHKESR